MQYHQLNHLSVEIKESIQLTPVIDTVVTCAKTWSLKEAVVLADSSVHSGADFAQLQQALQSAQGKGCLNAREVAQCMSNSSEFAGESVTRILLHEHGLPMPSEQVTLECDGFIYRPDFLWWDFMVILEFDGNIKYTEYGEREQVFGAQNERQARLMAQGFTVVRTDWNEVMFRPLNLVRKLRRAFERHP